MVHDFIVNGLWILGLSIVLATWAFARYAAYQDHVKTSKKFGEPKYALFADLGLVLFVGGMAATESRSWARLVWVILGIVIIGHAVLTVVRSQVAE